VWEAERRKTKIVRLKTINWSPSAGAYYLRLLSRQRQAIDGFVRALREADAPGEGFRQIDAYPDYWFARTATDVLMVVRKSVEAYSVIGFADWRQQYDLALEEAAAAAAELADADADLKLAA
jgi:hypothetical protein